MGEVGRKDDDGKLQYHLLPEEAEASVVRVLMHGAKKYEEQNWRRVPDARKRYYNAARRHLAAWRRGELIDPESGLPHLACAICSLMFLLELELEGLDKIRSAVEAQVAQPPVPESHEARVRIAEEMLAERDLQDKKWGEISDRDLAIPFGTGRVEQQAEAERAKELCNRAFEQGEGTWMDILIEEVAEVGAESDHGKMRAELVQVMAVAAKMIEVIDLKKQANGVALHRGQEQEEPAQAANGAGAGSL